MGKELKKSTENKMIAGVCSGLAKYFDMDPMLMRIIYAAATLFTGVFFGVVVYIILIFYLKE